MKLNSLGEFRVLTLRETCPALVDRMTCDTPERAAEYWRQHIAREPRFNGDVESLYGLALNTRRVVMGHYLVATGTLDTILAHPREVFRPAIVANAAAIIIMHNHPSGDPTPSVGDVNVTRVLIKGGELLKIDVLDHVIVGQPGMHNLNGFCSLRGLGYFA